MTGEIFPIEKEQAVGLERAAVWDAHHIVDRITITIMELHASG